MFASFIGLFAMPVESAFASEAFQRVGSLTSQPIGHYDYCKVNRRDCSIRNFSAKPQELNKRSWREMLEANNYANNTIEPRTDYEIYGVEEHWTMPETFGDCEDYVLMKRRYLMNRGWPAHALLPTVVLRPNGEGHAVLTVRTNRGDYILDNLHDEINRWDKTEYKYLKRVAASHSGRWEDILDTRSVVASIEHIQ